MKKIMFVCEGNVCRSPMAMFMLRNKIKEVGLDKEYEIISAGLVKDTEGRDIEPKVARLLEEANIPFGGHKAHLLRPYEFKDMDYVIYMERYHRILISRIMSGMHLEKTHRLLDYTDTPMDIEDPYSTGAFKEAFNLITKGVEGLVNYLLEQQKQG